MKRIINTFLISAASAILFSCIMEKPLDVPMNESIVLDLSAGQTKAAVQDSQTESFVNHIDVLILADNAGFPSTVKHYGRYQVNNNSRLTLSAKRSDFEENTPYHVYLIANSSHKETEFAAIASYNDLVAKKQEDRLLHLTGLTVTDAPEYFLMDAAVRNVTLNNGNPADNTVLDVTLRRAAAKIVVNVHAGSNVTFKNFSTAQGSDGALYYIRNLPYSTYLLAESKDDEDVIAEVTNTDREIDAHLGWNPTNDNKNVTLVTYAYPNSWIEGIIEHETCIIINLPMTVTSDEDVETDYPNSWYKIHVTGEKVIRRNNFYQVDIELNRPGAVSETIPVNVNDTQYLVEEWKNQTVNVGGEEKPGYLQLNTDHVDMYNVNVDNTSLEFASSSEIRSITLDEAYYYNYLDQQVNLATSNKSLFNSIKATVENGAINGKITITSPFVNPDSHSNAIRYLKFTVVNMTGQKATFTVAQAPTIYITNQLGYFSYRSDFGGTYYGNCVQNSNYSGAVWQSSGTWSYERDATSSKNFFASKVIGNAQSGGKYQILYAYFNSNRQQQTQNIGTFDNPRMYHVQVTATSSKYTVARPQLDADGYTESSAENALLVSPSFMIASQLGATDISSVGSSTDLPGGVMQAKQHCEQYVETYKDADGNVVHLDDWRLPTAAEIQIIIDHQDVSDAMAVVLSGSRYYCAYNPDTRGYTKESGKYSGRSHVRCVRDEY